MKTFSILVLQNGGEYMGEVEIKADYIIQKDPQTLEINGSVMIKFDEPIMTWQEI